MYTVSCALAKKATVKDVSHAREENLALGLDTTNMITCAQKCAMFVAVAVAKRGFCA
jgi:hypothetical protein